MRRLLIATTLGLGLLSAGAMTGGAFAHPVGERAPSLPAHVETVHYDHRDSRFDRHWHRTSHWHHGYADWRHGYDYGRR